MSMYDMIAMQMDDDRRKEEERIMRLKEILTKFLLREVARYHKVDVEIDRDLMKEAFKALSLEEPVGL